MIQIKKISELFARIENIFALLTCGIYLLMILIMAFDAIGRYFFNSPIRGSYEIVTIFLFPALVYLALSYTFRENAHIRIDFLLIRLNVKIRAWLETFSLVAVLIVSVVIFMQLWNRFTWSYGIKEIYIGVKNWPLYISFLSPLIGFLFLIIRSFLNIFTLEPDKLINTMEN